MHYSHLCSSFILCITVHGMSYMYTVYVMSYMYKNDHTSVTELMWGLYWLPIRARNQYKILLLVYKAFTNSSPTYLADMMTSCNPVRSTHSSHKVNSQAKISR